MIKGVAQHSRRLGAASRVRVGSALLDAGQDIELDAERSITSGAVSGAGHIPSAPGEAPNADTHLLDSNIDTVQESETLVTVTSHAPYSAVLEYGPNDNPATARPFMRPALERNRENIVNKVRGEVQATVRKTS